MSGPLPAFLSPLTVPASSVYGWIVAARNKRFDRGVGVESVDRPVISIGNITTGGTGKTPMVAWIAQQLLQAGHRPIIAMRGYKAVQGQMSDEQAEYAARLPDVHVIANPDRVEALRAFLPLHPELDCVLLDDGFQHRQLRRDLDLVLIDATAGTFRDRLLPAGNLREPPANLARADAVIVTHAESDNSNLKSQIERHHGQPPLAWARHVWQGLDVHERADSPKSQTIEWLAGKRVLTMLGVGKPQSILDQLARAGAVTAANIPCSDHELYDTAKITVARGLCTGCDAMVVTGKDWVKLRHLIDLSLWPVPVVVPRLAIDVFEGAGPLRDLVIQKARAATALNSVSRT